jgi:hypothetical protein
MNLPVPFDFFPTFIDPKKFLDNLETRQLGDVWADGELIFSPKHMTDEELAQSFIDDVLGVTIWEIQTGNTLSFDKAELLRYVSEDQHDRIWQMINHDNVVGLIEFNGAQIRIRNNKNILQAAMDYCGAYYNGFMLEDGVIMISANVKDSIQTEEELNAFATALAMELSGHPSNKTVN